ncbi:MAG: vWA domain-containing protein [Vulcanimicrobiaceae bacterium]
MSFERPGLLVLALLAIALAIWLYRRAERRSRAQALAYSNLAFALDALRPARWPAAVLFAAFALGSGALLVALAGPRFPFRVPAKDGTVMICIDTSGSMITPDLAPTRAEAAKAAARAFVDALPAGSRVGLVTFSSEARLVQQPTADLDAARAAIERIPGPDGATAIGDALALAAEAMPKSGARIIVLLTDGVSNRGLDPLEVAQTVGKSGITIDTVGVGTDSGQVIPGTNELAGFDSSDLRAIARSGNGTYVQAADAPTLRRAFRSLAFRTIWETKPIDGSFPVALGGGLVLLGTLLAGLALGRIP